jgi:hypothetical protein
VNNKYQRFYFWGKLFFDLVSEYSEVFVNLTSVLKNCTTEEKILFDLNYQTFVLLQLGATALLIFLLFYLHLNNSDYNVWGHERVAKATDAVVKAATGVILIGWVLKATAHVSGRMPWWPMVVLTVAAIACLVAFFTTNNIYTRNVL